MTRVFLRCEAEAGVAPALRDRVCARALAEAQAASARSVLPLAPDARPPVARDAVLLTLSLAGTDRPRLAAAVRRTLEVDESEAGGTFPPVALGGGPDPLLPVATLIRRALPGAGRPRPDLTRRGTE